MRIIISTLATASLFAFAASAASADCGGHGQVTASTTADQPVVAISTYDGPSPVLQPETTEEAKSAECAAGTDDCPPATE